MTINGAEDAPEFISGIDVSGSAPNIDSYDFGSLPEGSVAGTSVGTVVAEDVDGDTLSYRFSNGTQSDGVFTIDAESGEITLNQSIDDADLGDFTLSVVVSDDDFVTTGDTASVTISLDNSNDVPITGNNSVQTLEDTAYVFSTNDFSFTDGDGDSLSAVVIESLPANGQLQVFTGGSWQGVSAGDSVNAAVIDGAGLRYVPETNAPAGAADGVGAASFTFSVTDGVDSSAAATMTVSVVADADAPSLTLASTAVETDSNFALPAGNGLTLDRFNNVPNVNSSSAANADTLEGALASVTPNSGATVSQLGSGASSATAVDLASDGAVRMTGFVFLEAGHEYSLTGYRDDTLHIEIGGTTVLSSGFNNYGTYTTTGFTPTESGYYSIELYAYNGDSVGRISALMSVDGGANQPLSDFTLFTDIDAIDAAGGQHSDFVNNAGDGGYYPVQLNEGQQDTAIQLQDISAALTDLDGSESLAVVISQIPAGSVFSDGVNSFTATVANTSVDVTGWDMTSLTVTPPAGYVGEFDLTVTATSTESSNADQAAVAQDFTVVVNEVVVDLQPVAVDDSVSVNFGGEVTGNVITGSGAPGNNADYQGDAPATLSSITYNGVDQSAQFDSSTGTWTVDTAQGQLVIHQNGDYSYQSNVQSAAVTVSGTDQADWTSVNLYAFGWGQNYRSNGQLNLAAANASIDYSPLGIGVNTASGQGPNWGWDSAVINSTGNNGQHETLAIDLQGNSNSASVLLSDYGSGNNIVGQWQAYDSSFNLVDSGNFADYVNGNGVNTATVDISTSSEFQYLVFVPGEYYSAGYSIYSVSYTQLADPTDEVFEYRLTDADGDGTSAELTIIHDDTVQPIANVAAEEGESLSFSVTLSEASSTSQTFTFSIQNGSASTDDYGSISFSNGVVNNGNGTLTVPAGVTGFVVTVAGAEDSIVEADETFQLTVGAQSATGTIVNDDVSDGDELVASITEDQDLVAGTGTNLLDNVEPGGNAVVTDVNSVVVMQGQQDISDQFSILEDTAASEPGKFLVAHNDGYRVGELTVNADGTVSFINTSEHAFDFLAAGESASINIEYSVSVNGVALTETSNAQIDIAGVNDAPVAVNDTGVVEGGFASQFWLYHEGNGTPNLETIAQVFDYTNTHAADATFVSTGLHYGEGAGDLGGSGNLERWLGVDAQGDDFVRYNNDTSTDSIVRFSGVFDVQTSGEYEFVVRHDDGFIVLIDGEAIALADYITSPRTTTVEFDLTAGTHTVEVYYWDQGGQYVFQGGLYDEDGNDLWQPNNMAYSSGGITTVQDTPITVNVLANDFDIDGDSLSVVDVGAAQHGSVAISGNGTVTYTPNGTYTGLDQFTYTISDGTTTSQATVTIEVVLPEVPPTIDLDADDSAGAVGMGYQTTASSNGSVAIVDTDVTISNNSAGVSGAIITLQNAVAGDTLSIDSSSLPAGITASNFTADGKLVLSGPASLADYQQALQLVRFNGNGTSDFTARDITIAVTDDNGSSNVAHTTVNFAEAEPFSSSAFAASSFIAEEPEVQGAVEDDTPPVAAGDEPADEEETGALQPELAEQGTADTAEDDSALAASEADPVAEDVEVETNSDEPEQVSTPDTTVVEEPAEETLPGDEEPAAEDAVAVGPDASGDEAESAAATSANDVLTGTDSADVLNGLAGNDQLSGLAGDDNLIGGAGNDTLLGGAGADTFAWSLGDSDNSTAPAVDVVVDFSTAEGDSLDLSDLLQSESLGHITDYLHAESDGTDTVIHISQMGEYEGDYDSHSGATDQVITLEGVDLSGFSSSDDIIQYLISNNHLSIDQ